MANSSESLTSLGVAAIRDGVAKGDFTAREVAEGFNANVAAAQEALALVLKYLRLIHLADPASLASLYYE